MKKLQRKIMRGIYFAYALRLVSLPGVFQGFFMLTIIIVLTRFVSIGHVIQNFKSVEVAHVGRFFYNAVSTTEIWTLLLIGIFIFSLLSLRISLTPRHASSYSLSKA